MKTTGTKIQVFTRTVLPVLLVCNLFCGCSPSGKNPGDESIYDYKTRYIGNNTKVIGVVNRQDYPEGLKYASIAIDVIAIDTFCLLVKMQAEKTVPKEKLFRNAVATFALIDNLSELKYVNASNDTTIATFKRDAVNLALKENGQNSCEEIGKSKAAFFNYLDAE